MIFIDDNIVMVNLAGLFKHHITNYNHIPFI